MYLQPKFFELLNISDIGEKLIIFFKEPKMRRIHFTGFMVTVCIVMVTGCSTAPQKPESRAVLKAQVQQAIALFKQKDAGIEKFFKDSAGYAVLPKIAKAAIWIGGAYGKGHLYEKGDMVGYCSMSQATIGFSFGGEYFREIIFFKQKTDLDKFKSEEFTFSAQATAVALKTGAAAKVDYKDGMAVFVMTDKGLMVDASIGGQKFNYVAK